MCASAPESDPVPFENKNFCELWLMFVDPDGYRIAWHFVEPLLKLLTTYDNGALVYYYPIMSTVLDHCRRTQDAALLRIILLHFIAYCPTVRSWAMNTELPRDGSVQGWLPVGCEQDCIAALKGLCDQLAEMKITPDEFGIRAFCVLTTGCRRIGEQGWTYPPRANQRLQFTAGPDGAGSSDAAELMKRIMSTKKRRRSSTAKAAAAVVAGKAKVGDAAPAKKVPRKRGRQKKVDPAIYAAADAVPLGRKQEPPKIIGLSGSDQRAHETGAKTDGAT